jgi:hypothetical protein
LDIHTDITVKGENQAGVKIMGPANYSTLKGFPSDDIYCKAFWEIYYAPTPGDKTYIVGLITITNCTATVSNMTARGDPDKFYAAAGAFQAAAAVSGRRYLYGGIGVVNATATIEKVKTEKIQDSFNGGFSTYGIIAAGGVGTPKKPLTVTNCIIQEFQKNGAHILKGVSKVTFTGNTVIGSGGTNLLVAQNGMVIECLQAEISGNNFQKLARSQGDTSSLGVQICLTQAESSSFTQTFLISALASNTFDVKNTGIYEDRESSPYGPYPANKISVDNAGFGGDPISPKVYYLWLDKRD